MIQKLDNLVKHSHQTGEELLNELMNQEDEEETARQGVGFLSQLKINKMRDDHEKDSYKKWYAQNRDFVDKALEVP